MSNHTIDLIETWVQAFADVYTILIIAWLISSWVRLPYNVWIGRNIEVDGVALKEAIRKGLVANVPPPLYRRYELIRGRRGTAITSTTDGTCSVCHMRLPPMLFQELTRENKLEQCPSCNRILYYRPGVTSASQSDTP